MSVRLVHPVVSDGSRQPQGQGPALPVRFLDGQTYTVPKAARVIEVVRWSIRSREAA